MFIHDRYIVELIKLKLMFIHDKYVADLVKADVYSW